MDDILAKGTQVIYVPGHAKHDHDFENGCEAGFVAKGPNKAGIYWVRYWYNENGHPVHKLRTRANSEATNPDALVVEDTVPQEWVDQIIRELKL